MKSEEKAALLNPQNEEIGTVSRQTERAGVIPCEHLKTHWLFICACLYGVITTILLARCFSRSSNSLVVPYSPIKHLIEPVLQDVYPEKHSVYSKEPSEELDKAWAELVHPMLIQTYAEEVQNNNENPEERLELVQGGYLGSLGVFHELHCLRRLSWHMYEDIYFQNYTESAREYERAHARHCIEALRRSLMCQANTALYTFAWDENNTHAKQVLTSKAKRQCVKWEPIHAWASSRTVGLNPTFYPPGGKPAG
ncbi:uncharacterized protein EI97DRAFT_456029 [Westerdykella ornata]|uniref:Uncharacterized protein n=1 Tax=Westerdykella ornata TaxID=318751 RepID=A0A6A6JUB1_WESOR|nr:uncharacterized protein EI97DRAFT_456029 [Westerdykella ornata]KAF2279835.1 hypothetical protein EI97DRAFT_456029 [Westerdykella ornata]